MMRRAREARRGHAERMRGRSNRSCVVVFLASLLFLAMACGRDDPATVTAPARATGAGSQANQSPQISAARLVPKRPRSGQSLSVMVNVYDPEGDRLSVTYAWERNGQVIRGAAAATLPPSQFRRGDRVAVLVRATDASHAVAVRTDPVTIQNEAPRVASVDLTPEAPTVKDALLATPHASDPEGDPLEFHYVWFVNGRRLPKETGPALAPGVTKRGDKVQVRVVARDGQEDSAPAQSSLVRLQNSAPQIVSRPVYRLGEDLIYRYQIKARDADHDHPLRYDLREGPPGMSIDAVGGLLSWSVSDGTTGRFPVDLSVSDLHGGQTSQRYVLQLEWQPGPAATP